jgi:hypothetical protein
MTRHGEDDLDVSRGELSGGQDDASEFQKIGPPHVLGRTGPRGFDFWGIERGEFGRARALENAPATLAWVQVVKDPPGRPPVDFPRSNALKERPELLAVEMRNAVVEGRALGLELLPGLEEGGVTGYGKDDLDIPCREPGRRDDDPSQD